MLCCLFFYFFFAISSFPDFNTHFVNQNNKYSYDLIFFVYICIFCIFYVNILALRYSIYICIIILRSKYATTLINRYLWPLFLYTYTAKTVAKHFDKSTFENISLQFVCCFYFIENTLREFCINNSSKQLCNNNSFSSCFCYFSSIRVINSAYIFSCL